MPEAERCALEDIVYGVAVMKERRIKEKWSYFLSPKTAANAKYPYRFSHDFILLMANNLGRRAPKLVINYRVTDFTDWIFSLYRSRDRSAMATGADVAFAVLQEQMNANARKNVALRTAEFENSDWQIIYLDALDGVPEPLEISALKINGRSLWGSPDIVFRNRQTGVILIIENKASNPSNRELPSDSWPNARAQLWAYGQIDRYAEAEQVILMTNVWSYIRGINRGTLQQVLIPRLVAVTRWDKRDPVFNAQNLELFTAYKKQCE